MLNGNGKPPHKEPIPLLYADTQKSADMLYFGHVQVPDPFIALELKKKRVAVVSALEFNRVRNTSVFDTVWSLEDLAEKAKKQFQIERASTAHIIRYLALKHKLSAFRVPQDFPVKLAFELMEAGLQVEAANGLFFPKREIKSDEEAAQIRKANAVAAAAFKHVENILTEAEIRKGKLYYQDRPLTSERLQTAIGIVCLEHQAAPNDPIVAGGDQACDPHHRGSGPLRANQLIIVDIFPRLLSNGYYGDMTRTYLKGQASEAQKKLVATVEEAQKLALRRIRAGLDGRVVFQEVKDYFTQAGFATKKEDGVNVGFFHGLGHGLGLEIHEPPRVGPVSTELTDGQVVTVEPGLYYPGLGGCRMEDVVRVQAEGVEMLSRHPYRWQID